MIDTLLATLAPHPCCGCGITGQLLCVDCKYNITSEGFAACLACGRPVQGSARCARCALPYTKAWVVGERGEALAALIDQYKFERARSAHRLLAELLDGVVPELPSSTVVVPVPTIAKHIRLRGYDHTLLLARALAKRRKLVAKQVLTRHTTTVQLGASKVVRERNAKEAYGVNMKVDNVPHLLIDDVVTTGATLRYAAEALLLAGASEVWVAAVARQPMD